MSRILTSSSLNPSFLRFSRMIGTVSSNPLSRRMCPSGVAIK
jgi:hypothetical protein